MSMFRYSICAFLAPAFAAGAAFPWALPEPTFVIPAADNWSPAPTPGPEFGAIELFRRAADGNTCGYVSAQECKMRLLPVWSEGCILTLLNSKIADLR